MRTTSIISKNPGDNTILNYQYTFDGMDNIKTKTTEHGDYPYTYDDLYRLTSSETTNPWNYNKNNKLAGFDDVAYVYDNNGNMIRETAVTTITTYVYNTEDRLTQVWNGEPSTGTLIAEYYYDPFGRRLYKEVSGVRTYFHYADEGLVAEFDSTGTETKSYGSKPNSTWTTDPLFMKIGDAYFYFQTDHIGTPQKIIAGNGEVVWSVKYNSFGEATIEVETVENNLRFPGQFFDKEIGLHYNWHRYYDLYIGRYLTPDPIGIKGGINLYVYVEGEPINSYDFEGLEECCNEKEKNTLKNRCETTVYNLCKKNITVVNKKGQKLDNEFYCQKLVTKCKNGATDFCKCGNRDDIQKKIKKECPTGGLFSKGLPIDEWIDCAIKVMKENCK